MTPMTKEAEIAFYEAVEAHERYSSNRKKHLRYARPLINRFAKLHECPINQAFNLVDEYRGARRIAAGEKFVLYR